MVDAILYMLAAFGVIGLCVLVLAAWAIFTNDWSK